MKHSCFYSKVKANCVSMFQNLPDHVTANGDQMSMATPSMIRSHSVSGDLHGVQPDPVAADILRKEPEHETFVRLRISPSGIFLIALSDALHFYRNLNI